MGALLPLTSSNESIVIGETRIMLPPKSALDRVREPGFFVWGTGIEDTFIAEPNPRTGRTLDEYELTGHYDRWKQDLDLIASLGVSAARYGIPWYKVQPKRDQWDWSWPDQTLERMLAAGVEPIVDLVHYGVPGWLEGSLLDAELGERMAEYAFRFAERYRDRVRWYTPLNEPRINAWYAGKLGWWPPFRRGWKGFAEVLVSLSEAIVLTHGALKQADPEIVCVHVDPADRYFTLNPELVEETAFRQEVVFLALDLVTGRVDEHHRLWPWLLKQGVEPERLRKLREAAVQPDIVGINCYPLFGHKEILKGSKGILLRNRYGDGNLLKTLLQMYWDRYQIPLMVTETASAGRKRGEWLEQSVQAVVELRKGGVPVVGYVWWPLFSIVGWAYQKADTDVGEHIVDLGLWDLDGSLNRIPNPVMPRYRDLVSKGAPVGVS